MSDSGKCDCCGRDGVMEKRVTRSYGKGEGILVIEGIPMLVCPHCGESYFTADTLQEVERLRLHRGRLRPRAMAPVVSYV